MPIKDSGERLNFPSGMVRDVTTGKIKWHLIRSGPMLKRWAIHMTGGSEKYGDDNWMKANGPEELKRFMESADRHFNQWVAGETDEDHAAAVFFNVNGAEYVKLKMAHAGLDAIHDAHAPGVRNDAEVQETRKAILWKAAGRKPTDDCDSPEHPDGWVCELPTGHDGKHSAPGCCSDW